MLSLRRETACAIRDFYMQASLQMGITLAEIIARFKCEFLEMTKKACRAFRWPNLFPTTSAEEVQVTRCWRLSRDACSLTVAST